MNDRQQPQNIDAEQCVLGAILIDPDALLKAMEIISVEDFYADKHRIIFDSMIDCYQLGETIDLVSISNRVLQKGELEKVGGSSYLAALVSLVPTSANIRRDSRLVKEKSIQRRVLQWAHNVQNQAYSGVENQREWFSEIQKGVVSLSESVKEKKSPHISDILHDLDKQWLEFKQAKSEESQKGKYCTVPLFKPFNAEAPIPYYMPGQLWMLAGYTSAGKSTTLAQLLVDACAQGAKALVFSLEEGRTTKAVKMISNLTNIPQRYLLTGQVDNLDAVYESQGVLKSWGLMVYDDVRTLDEIRLKAKKHSMQGGLDIIAIDYVQNIVGEGTSIYNDMRLVGPTLLDMALELGVTVIALSQVTNESMRGESEVIGLKGAGELAAAADIVLWLKRKKGYEHFLDCEIRKNRAFGITGTMELEFNDRFTKVRRRGERDYEDQRYDKSA